MTHFIGEWFIDENICDNLIDFFENSEYTKDKKVVINETKSKISRGKKSIDISLPIKYDCEAMVAYRKALNNVCLKYMQKFPYCNKYDPWDITEFVNIQYYKPGWGYNKFHTERSGPSAPFAQRHLVFMTYLNTVTDEGETEFLHQDLKVKAEKGKTLIWPADWTYTHRGIPSPTQEKYIITGWYSFVDTLQ